MEPIDLRSDTVSKPTPEMREAMAGAEVGDDVYGEDPSINLLQEKAAAMLGKEAALFVPSGTMGNLASILAHCNRGDEVIMGDKAHTVLYEAGGISALGGVHSRQIPNLPDGTLNIDAIRSAIRPDDAHHPITRLIALENTHNRCGGVAITPEYTKSVGDLADEHGIFLHIDGARIFNAAIALGVDAKDLAEPADSITFCLSKALCAPVGSIICGSKEFIRKAHRIRKQLGGGMRQAGILAAAGIVALDSMVERLHEDHLHAQQLADGLRKISGLILDPGTPHTNMVFLSLDKRITMDARELASRLANRGIKVGVTGERRFRLVTHYWISEEDIQKTVAAFGELL